MRASGANSDGLTTTGQFVVDGLSEGGVVAQQPRCPTQIQLRLPEDLALLAGEQLRPVAEIALEGVGGARARYSPRSVAGIAAQATRAACAHRTTRSISSGVETA